MTEQEAIKKICELKNTEYDIKEVYGDALYKAIETLKAVHKMKDGKPYMYIKGCIEGDNIYEIKADVWAYIGHPII